MRHEFPDFDNFTVVMLENIPLLREFTLNYLRVNSHPVYNIPSNSSEKYYKIILKDDKIEDDKINVTK